jgi:adenylate cyclase
MLQELTELNQTFVNDNKPQALIGIGINTGEMNVGDMGSDFRRSYTVIGDAVNLGARLEGLTKFYGVEILVSEFTRQQALEYEYCLVDKVKVKGKAVPVTIYSPISHSASEDEIREKNEFNLCVELYFAQHFQAALELILLLSATMKNQHLLELYKQRIEQFLFQPPPTEWDGSFTHINK